jgi:Flp pilus assembly CpaE family ATPase
MPPGERNSVSSANVSRKVGAVRTGGVAAETISVAVIGPDEEKRSVLAKALSETHLTSVREFISYPPGNDHLERLLSLFDLIFIDLDGDPETALRLVERAGANPGARISVYSENTDTALALRAMQAGVREFLVLPLKEGALEEVLLRAMDNLRPEAHPAAKPPGELLVFTGAKGGSGVTTVASNIAIALAGKYSRRVLLIDLALPIGDTALSLGIASKYSTEDALRNIDRLDEILLQRLLCRHRSGVFVLAAPTRVSEVEVTGEAIEKLVAIARSEFDDVVVDVGSRVDIAAKALFKSASTIYLVTQTGISELRNSNRLISQFFTEGSPNLEIVINRAEPRFLEAESDVVLSQALGRPVQWKIPNDQNAARALQSGDTGPAEDRISRISMEMAGSITERASAKEETEEIAENKDLDFKDLMKSTKNMDSGNEELPVVEDSSMAGSSTLAEVVWPALDPIRYGDKLSPAQLNAKASVAGTFVYTPGLGYVLPVGTHTLWVTFTPAKPNGSGQLQVANPIVVMKGAPALSWRAPSEMPAGTPLDGTYLNATASVPGKFEYSPAAGHVLPPGTHTISVTFTPADETRYTTASATTSLTVAREKPAIQWKVPNPIEYGTRLSATQLCATASVPGKFEYTPGLRALLAAGEHPLSVVFTPADSSTYSAIETTVTLRVVKARPTIEWKSPDPVTYGAALGSAQLNATANAPGSLVYSPAAGEILAPGAHEISVTFFPADTLNYTTKSAVVSIVVREKVSPQIAWPSPSSVSYGTALSATQLNATASVPGTFVYAPSEGHVLAPGRYGLTASFTPTDTERFAKVQAVTDLVVEGSPETDSMSAAATEETCESALDATLYALPGPAPAKGTESHAAATAKPRQTRVYKGAVYEKGEDGQWHLQKE